MPDTLNPTTHPPRTISRLEKTFRRLEAQMVCIAFALDAIAGREGVVIELGLGLGRTYDHLARNMPGRDIYAFDRSMGAYPDCAPAASFFVEGDIEWTFPRFAQTHGGRIVLANADLGSFDRKGNLKVAEMVSRLVPPALAPGGILMSDLPLTPAGCEPLPLPEGAQEGCYYLYRKPG